MAVGLPSWQPDTTSSSPRSCFTRISRLYSLCYVWHLGDMRYFSSFEPYDRSRRKPRKVHRQKTIIAAPAVRARPHRSAAASLASTGRSPATIPVSFGPKSPQSPFNSAHKRVGEYDDQPDQNARGAISHDRLLAFHFTPEDTSQARPGRRPVWPRR